MAYTTDQLADLLFKKVITGKSTSDNNKAFFEESINSRKAIFAEDVWNQSSLIPTTAPVLPAETISGVVQFKENIPLIPIPGTNSFTTGIVDIIPFNFGDGSYDYVLKDGNGDRIAPGTADWFLDPDSGLVTFFDGGAIYGIVIATGTLTLTVYKYVGTKGVGGALVGGSGGSRAGWLAPALSQIDNTVFESLPAPTNGDRYLVTTTTGAVVDVYDPDAMTVTPGQIIPANSVVERFDDGSDIGWIVDFNGAAPSEGAALTILDEPGYLYQYYTGMWNQHSFERTIPGREYKSLTSSNTLVDGDEVLAASLPGGLSTTPTEGTYVAVLINGVQISIQDSNTALGLITEYCYFSSDGGANSKSLDSLSPGDRLYWKGSNSGYELDSADRIDINFVKNNL